MNVKFSKPIGTHYWINYLVLSEKPNTSSLYFFIFKFLEENKLKMFRWKPFHFIIPNKVLPCQYIKRIKGNKTLQKGTFLMKVKKYILKGK